MQNDTAILLVLADMQRTIEALRAENAELRQSLTDRPPCAHRWVVVEGGSVVCESCGSAKS